MAFHNAQNEFSFLFSDLRIIKLPIIQRNFCVEEIHMAMPARDIIYQYCEGKMSGRPEFYSGRGNNPGDLNSELLEKVYSGIKTENGDKAANSFVQMVAALTPDASATTFLVSLYRLERAGWEFNPAHVPQQPNEAFAEAIADAARKDPDTASITWMIGSFVGGGSISAGSAYGITGDFLMNHGVDLAKITEQRPGARQRKPIYGLNEP